MAKRFERVVLKVSGESLSKPGELGIDPEELGLLADEIADAYRKASPVQLAVVVGGGNIIRGARLAATGKVDQSTADYMGMLGTVINGLALKEALSHVGIEARVMSAINLTAVAEPFIRARAIRHLEKGRVVILVAGTGNPFFTTDTGAALRAAEMNCDAMLKGTQVDGVYTSDPKLDADATRFDTLDYMEVLSKELKVMDATAISLLKENKIPIEIFRIRDKGGLENVLTGRGISTVISGKKK